MNHPCIEAAYNILKNAYAPYSKFSVGAAIQSEGNTFLGVNVENASYGLTCCAESSAIAMMVTSGFQKIDTIAIVSSSGQYTYPCGACLQRIAEFSHDQTVVLLHSTDQGSITHTLSELLPYKFDKSSLSTTV